MLSVQLCFIAMRQFSSMTQAVAAWRGRVILPTTALLLAAVGLGCGDSRTPTSPSPSPPPFQSAPPTLACPADFGAVATNAAGAVVSFALPVPSGGVVPVSVSCTPASGSAFPVGATGVRCTATAADNQAGGCSFNIRVTPPPTRLSRTRFLAFGDSLTSGEIGVPVPVTARFSDGYPAFKLVVVPQASYPSQTEAILSMRYPSQAGVIAITNAGLSGEWAADGARRFPAVMSALRPEAVLLLEGANDLAALGPGGLSPAASAVESMAREARFRGARVLMATLPPSRAGGRSALSTALLQTYNSRVQAIARGEGALLVDVYSALVSDLNAYIGIDGLHPTEAGYRRMAELFAQAIRGEFEVRDQQ